MKNKRTFSVIILFLTTALCILRSFCMLNDYSSELGYFDPSAMVILMRILSVLTVVFCIATPFLTKAQDSEVNTASIGRTAVSVFTGVLTLISGIGILASAVGNGVITLLLGLFMIAGSAFFFTNPKRRVHAYLGFAVLAFLFCMLFHIYFDMYVAINSPLKISLQLCLLCGMIYVLMLIRRAIGRPAARFTIGAELVCAALCLPTSVSHLVYTAFGDPSMLTQNVLSPFLSLPILALGVFAAYGAVFKK